MRTMKNVIVAVIMGVVSLAIAAGSWAEIPAIKLVSPNGGEILSPGASYTISWTYTGMPGDTAKIVLLKNSVFFRTLNLGAPMGSSGSGSFVWKVPATLEPRSDYKIRIVSTSSTSVSDESDSNFSVIGAPSRIAADSVTITRTNNALKSTNLQDALNDELAVDLAALLPGSTWTIINKGNYAYSGNTGSVTFSNGTLTLDAGTFGAVGISNEVIEGCKNILPFNYEIINNSTFFITWDYTCPGVDRILHAQTTSNVFVNDINRITVTGIGIAFGHSAA